MPHEPAVDRAEREMPGLGRVARTVDVIENPAHLAAREVGVDPKTRAARDERLVAARAQTVAEVRGAPVLPDDGVVDGLAGPTIPHDGRLSLVGDPDGGDVDPAEKEGGSLGVKIPRLTNFLAKLHEEEVKQQIKNGQDPSKAPPPELLIIADRITPYRLLLEVMFSAKQKEAGYKHFRLIVQKNFPNKPPK